MPEIPPSVRLTEAIVSINKAIERCSRGKDISGLLTMVAVLRQIRADLIVEGE